MNPLKVSRRPARARRFLAAAALAVLALRADAVCLYLPDANAIQVYDYAEAMPCRPRQLLFADQVNGWGRVQYDRASDTYTVNASLWIGRNNGTDTFFQLGASNHPAETLVLNGDLVIYPTRIPGESPAGDGARTHRLTIGCPDNAAVRSQLLFRQAPGQSHTLRAGAYFRRSRMAPGVLSSGQLHVHNGRIAAFDPAQPIRDHLFLYLDEFVMRNGTIADVRGTIGYGLSDRVARITGGVWERSRTAFGWGRQAARGLTFRHLETVVLDSERYPLNAELTACRFESNDVNWALSSGRIYLVDCEVGPPLKGNRYAARRNEPADRLRVVSSRHVVVELKDAAGRAARDAMIQAVCEQNPAIRRSAATGADGRTPGPGDPGALLLDEWEERATETANQPERRTYSYAIQAVQRRSDPVALAAGLRPTRSWVVISLALPPASAR